MGESQTVTIPVNISQLAVWTVDGTFVVESGALAVKVWTSDTTFLNTTLTVQ